MKKLIPLILLLSFNIKAQEVTIGTQTWTTKNLDVSTYRNGDVIPEVQNSYAWAKLTTGAWCYYQNKRENGRSIAFDQNDNAVFVGNTYGKLYNWYAVNDPRGLAPQGYHIPSNKEWTILTDYLGGESVAGEKMKSRSGWYINGNGNNTSGFAGLPGGSRSSLNMQFSYNGNFNGIDERGRWWSSTEGNTDDAWCRELYCKYDDVSTSYDPKQRGNSVRCLRDLPLLKNSTKAQDVTTYLNGDVIPQVQDSGAWRKLTTGAQEIKIGKQTWKSKNLDVETYRNGDAIPQVQDEEEWAKLTTGAWCYYENKNKANYDSIGAIYGKLYNWHAVNDPRGLAPNGYHIPTDEEWTTLSEYLAGQNFTINPKGANTYTIIGDGAGSKMKSKSGWGWGKYKGNGSNTSGFAGLPGGYRIDYGDFTNIGATGNWWSSSEGNTNYACYRELNYTGDVHKGYYYRLSGLSVRCLRD